MFTLLVAVNQLPVAIGMAESGCSDRPSTLDRTHYAGRSTCQAVMCTAGLLACQNTLWSTRRPTWQQRRMKLHMDGGKHLLERLFTQTKHMNWFLLISRSVFEFAFWRTFGSCKYCTGPLAWMMTNLDLARNYRHAWIKSGDDLFSD